MTKSASLQTQLTGSVFLLLMCAAVFLTLTKRAQAQYNPSQTSRFSDTIVITNGEWPPYQSRELPHFGFASLIVTEAFALQGVQVNYEFRPWKRALEEARAGQADGSMLWSLTPEREPDFLFSDTILISEAVLFHRKDFSFDWQQNTDLEVYRIGGTLGYEYAIEKGAKLSIERVASDEQNFRRLLLKRIEIFPSDKHAGYALLNRSFPAAERAQISHHPKPYDQTAYSVIFSKACGERCARFLAQFNKGLQLLKTSGRYDEIMSLQQLGKFQSPQATDAN